MHQFGVAVIGTGMASAPHAKSLVDLKDKVDVRAVYSPNPERRQRFAELYGFPQADHLNDILHDHRIDAVLLLTPPNARLELVQKLASSGKHILMEKPVERTLHAATNIVALCDEAEIKLGIVFQHRFREASKKLKAVIDDGILGEFVTAEVSVPWWRPQSYYDEPGRGTYQRDGGGVLISQAIHSLDLLLSFTGEPIEVSAIAGTTSLHQMESEDFVSGSMRFENGALGNIMATTARYPGEAETISIGFEQAHATLQGGTLHIQHHDGRVEEFGETQATGGGADPMAFPHDWHMAVIDDFIEAVQQNRDPAVSGNDALAVHRLIDALVRSSKEKRHVSLP